MKTFDLISRNYSFVYVHLNILLYRFPCCDGYGDGVPFFSLPYICDGSFHSLFYGGDDDDDDDGGGDGDCGDELQDYGLYN